MRQWRLFFLFLFLTGTAAAQTTLVSGTITDGGGQTWNNGTYTFTFYPSPSNPLGPYFQNGVKFNINTTISGSLSNTGSIGTVSVPDNLSITPFGSLWTVKVCPAASAVCYQTNLTITGPTQSISATVVPPAAQVFVNQPPTGYAAYNDSEIVGARQGTFYSNLTDGTVHYCANVPPCVWVSITSGSANLSLTGNLNVAGTSTLNNLTVSGASTFSGTGNTGTLTAGSAILGGTNAWTGTETHSGSESFSGPFVSTGQNQLANASILNTVLYVGSGITNWTGSDIGAQINSAYGSSSCPATGCTIVVLPKTGGGSYQFSTPITFNVAHKTVLLTGIGPAGTPQSSQNQGTILEYTPTTATAAILFDDLDASGSGYTRAHGMRDIALWNNHTFTAGGTGSSAIGVSCGTNTQACQLADFVGVFIGGFGTGISITSANSWGWTVERSSIVYNTTGMLAVGENTAVTDSVIAANGTGISSNCGELNIKGGSLDSNTVTAINYTNAAGGCILDLHGVHFENLGLSTGTFGMPYIIGNPNLRVHGGTFIDDCNGSSNCGNQANSTTGFISIGTAAMFDDPQFNSSGRTQNSGVIQITGSSVSRVSGRVYSQTSVLPTTPATFVGGSQAQFNSLEVTSNTTAIGTVVKQQEGDLLLGVATATGGGQLRLTETTARTAHASESDCQGNSANHDLECAYNGGSYFHIPQVIGSGTAVMTTAAITAGNCGTTVTVAAAGVATTDTITWAFNAAPAGSNAGIVAWPTSGNVNFAYCSNTAQTPAAATINWRVVR